MGRSRTVSTSGKIPKGATVADLERGYVETLRISYSYCLDCGRIMEGWYNYCTCTGKGRRMKQSWTDVNFAMLIHKMGVRKRHKLPMWGTVG